MNSLLHPDHPWSKLRLEFKEQMKPVSILKEIKQEHNEECFLKRNCICESPPPINRDNKENKNCYEKHCLIM